MVRSRIVARQFATESLEHLFAGTPDATVLRAILSNLATDKDKVLLVADVTSAYYQAPVVIDQYVRPPTDQREKGKLWKLKRAMPGLRIPSRSWQNHYASVVEKVLGQTRPLVDSSEFCLESSNGAAGFPATAAQSSFTRHCCWHRIFELSTSILHYFLTFLVFRNNEVNNT